MTLKRFLLISGNIISILAGVVLGVSYGVAVGITAWYALSVLVDIRDQTNHD